jgi:hypothetical protein
VQTRRVGTSRGPGALLVLLGTAVAVLAAACGDETATEGPVARSSAIQAAAIRAVAEDRLPDVGEAGPDGPLFLVGNDDRTIELEVQVGVIERLDDWATVRFIDSIEEAVVTDDPEEPVRGDGLLLGLGTIPDGDRTVVVPVTVHDGPGRATAYEVTVSRRGGDWVVIGPLRSVPVTVPAEDD